MASTYCSNCGQSLTESFCANCGAAAPQQAQQQFTAQQGLAQAGLEVQTFNVLLIVDRIVGLLIGLAVWWFVAGPLFSTDAPLLVIVSFFVLAFIGVIAGQWITLKLIRG